jgi:hypothetical protein
MWLTVQSARLSGVGELRAASGSAQGRQSSHGICAETNSKKTYGGNTIQHDPEFRFPDDHIRRTNPTGQVEVTAWRRVSVSHMDLEEWQAVLAHWDKTGAP